MPVLTLSQAINTGLRRALEDDPAVIVMGQDVGGLGGVFRVTDGLQKDFGADRVIDTPLAEAGIVGTAIGLALRGYRPVCEIQFDGFVYPAFNQIVSQLAKLRARSGGRLALPVVVRIPVGGGIGAVEHHSESNEAYFAHTAGLRVVCCSNPQDGHWLLRQAIDCDDPVIFYEPKRRYWSKSDVPEDPGDLPRFEHAQVLRDGGDVTVLTYGGMVDTCLRAAEAAEEEGHSLEVIDLRTLSPLDIETITESVRETGRCVVVHEAPTFAGLGAEIGAAVTEHCFYHLEAPVLRVGGYNTPYPPAKFEDQYLPDLDRVLDAVDQSFAW
ncbi:alpha-ketoacid dehydrogenase subunit beta [Prauserella muralis]|uniref:2-oxoisovalerate dehydrogenase n=1 Tax=Prauserella muralis TaxID=588067 RepID=A0A2V4AJ97_9PSEU|nr:alpha-ketoacid dehydrogenase subunit beta [Prauserella muralis]PXY18923.1 2-oxoisovalerate dehydrogenase [Prauserella muralis]TWE28801.1 pyruvate dehydrogenase E1 component beta subunit [Prauserella muralis]